MHAFERRRHRLVDGWIVDDNLSFVLPRRDLLRRDWLNPRDAFRQPIQNDVDPTERLATEERLDDADAVDLMREPAVRVAGDDDVDQSVRQTSGNSEDLRVLVA